MAGIDIQAKVRSGLGKAVGATGSGDLVYVTKETSTAGTPISPPVLTKTSVLLVDAIFKSISVSQMTNTLIQQGDRQMVSNSDVAINLGEEITQGSRKMIVVVPGYVEPSGVVLVYKSVVRDM